MWVYEITLQIAKQQLMEPNWSSSWCWPFVFNWRSEGARSEWVRRSGAKLNDDDGMATPASWWQCHEQLLITELFWISRSFLINYSSNEVVLNNCRLFKWMYYVERAACGGKNSNLSYQQIKIDGFFAVICRKFHQFQHTTYQKCVQLEPVFWIYILCQINIEIRLSNLKIVCW